MKSYNRLTQEERYYISALKASHLSIRQIAKQLKRSHSSILREIHRNSQNNKYSPKKAQQKALVRRQFVGPPLKIKGKLAKKVKEGLEKQWSPEQISGRLRKEKRESMRISHESIYQYIFRDFKKEGDLYKHLRKRRRWRRCRKASKNLKNAGCRQYNNWIDKRPSIVDRRCRIGDFERDTLLGKFRGPVLLTIVERKTRLTKIGKVSKICSELTHKATMKLLKNMKVRTITNDNGPEFARHEETAKALKAKVYFNHPYSSWERGTNENTNGLIRQYYPKGTDFSKVGEKELKRLERLLNSRPRKCLGYKTPFEVYKE